MSMVAEALIEVHGVIFDECFDILSDVRSNEISEVFGRYIGVFILLIG
jgi:hypothetical protein